MEKEIQNSDIENPDILEEDDVISSEIDELAGEQLVLRIGKSIQERRLDKYLKNRFSNFSRTTIQRLIKGKEVKVNGAVAKQSQQLCAGDVVELTLPEPEVKEIVPEDIPINVIYEDDDILVINKQAGIIIHPARGYKSGTLVNGLVNYASSLSSGSEHFRPGIVHRLDRNTTGVMVVTKNDEAQWKVATQFQDRITSKTYIAIAQGAPELDADRIKNLIGMHPSIREKMAVRPDVGKEAITIYEVLERFRGYSLIKLRLLTGRTHQLRVHLSHLGHPIVADDMYGGKVVYEWQIRDQQPQVQDTLLARCALHAWKLELVHPSTGKRMEFTAEMPPDMQRLLELLRECRSISKKPIRKAEPKRRIKPHEVYEQ